MDLLPLYTAVAAGIVTLVTTVLTLNSQAKKNVIENRLAFTRFQSELNDTIWERAKNRMEAAESRVERLEAVVEDERTKRHEIESALREERDRRQELEMALAQERRERRESEARHEQDRRSFEARISVLEKEKDALTVENERLKKAGGRL
jgi:chromosome segregation ATPase